MKNFLKKKIQRLLISKNVMKFFYLFHYFNGGYKSKKIDISFKTKKNRIEIVQKIIDLKKFKTYLEIGTFKNELFSQIMCHSKIGVDPTSGGTVRDTSDNFFSKNTEKFNLIFIDGLHHYEQVKRDIKNSLYALKDGGIILLHDCMPRNYYYQAVPRCQIDWNGDTWRAFLEFRTKENVDSYCCYADEGIGVILKRKNRKKLELNQKNFSEISFNDYAQNYKHYLNLIEYEELLNVINDYE